MNNINGANLERLIEQIVGAVMAELSKKDGAPEQNPRDITTQESRKHILLQNPRDAQALARMKTRTNARIGVGRTGARYNTQTLLTLRADHASARDAVFLDVSQKILDDLGLFTANSRCASKNEFLTRPDLGRQLDEESCAKIRASCVLNPDIQIFATDGLSSTAISANLPDLLPCLLDGLKNKPAVVGTPFFVKNGRVGIMEPVSELLGARVTCVLIGERPGLATAESMSAYIAYNARVGMEEALRTVVSNIHANGVPAVEAGAYLADLLYRVCEAKASGINLRRTSAK
ncbi:ethanolamine ammonia-lyase light chain [Synergistales bacterium]|nr:ethanolamine ammonia-lyase light chain [Synergistales bacterium]